MGAAYCWINSLEPSDWIGIVGIIVNAALAYWIVSTIQNKLTNRRILKDHFINEVKEIRNEYRLWMNSLYSNKIPPKRVIPWFKLMNVKVTDLMILIHDKYQIDKLVLTPYQRDLQELVTNNEDFISQFRNSKPIEFSEVSKNSFLKFQQDNNHLFNTIIVKINDAV